VLLLIGLPTALAVLLLLAGRLTALKYAPAALCVGLFAAFAGYLPVIESAPYTESIAWVDSLGLALALYADGLGLLFALLVTGVGAVVALYAAAYFEDDAERTRFSVLLMAFMSAMLGVVLAGNVLTLFCAWELTSITSFFLIGFKGGKSADARQSAARALVVTGAGGLALLAGLVLMGTAAGSYDFGTVLGADLRDHPWYSAITLLVLLGAFTKSAQVPFHFWLPGAMAAPSPASAYLHAATMVKAGVYLILRLYPTLGNTELWNVTVGGVGMITFVWGAYAANRQRDMKGLLAYTTVSALGSLVALAGLPNQLGIKAALIGILAHGAYKAALFLITGAVEHATGTRNLDQLGGLRHKMPLAFGVALVSSLSMAGVPPLLGFMAKDAFLEANFPEPLGNVWPLLGAFVGSALIVSAALTLVWDAFIRPPRAQAHDAHADEVHHADEHHHHHAVPMLAIAPAALAVFTLVIPFALPVLQPLINAALGKVSALYLFPPHPEPVLVSLAALGVGWGLMQSRLAWANASMPRPSFGPRRKKRDRDRQVRLPTAAGVYDRVIKGIDSAGDLALKLQSGKIRYYLAIILGTLSLLIVVLATRVGDLNPFALFHFNISGGTDVLKFVLLAATLGGTLASILIRNHLVAVLALGLAGYALGGVFLLEPAPDVALVQILVETLATVVLMLMLARIDSGMRQRAQNVIWDTSILGRWRDIGISVVIGVAVGALALTVVSQRPERAAEDPISVWHLLNTYPQIKVTDAVGAIVTDFRGMDTMLEIAVFATAGLGVLLLLTTPGKGNRETAEMQAVLLRHDSSIETPLTGAVARLAVLFALLVAASHWLYGGGQPGDGFTAGVIAGLAVSLSYIVRGYRRTRAIFPWLKSRLIVLLGLTIAVVNALLFGVLGSGYFLRVQDWGDAPAGLHFSSTLLFELAIGLTVFGAVTMVMDTIAHPGTDTDEG
jgi:NADH:ubiquinone oxidoreductase subunit 5 (subunit L)/multisubunit Na+/H+ antiporter MnhA subunit/multisubunit Na+/H+ antiporter MnhB subunit